MEYELTNVHAVRRISLHPTTISVVMRNINKFLCVALANFFPLISDAVTLDGTWQSDKEKTLSWNEAHSKMDSGDLKKLSYILGHTYIMYSAGKICVYFDPYEVNGRKSEPLSTQESTYKIIAENESGVIIRESYSDGHGTISMLVFESNDSFYGVMLDTEDYGKPGYREYYKKISEPEKSNQSSLPCKLK